MAHPDDEVLGAGASIWKWAHNGDKELDDDTHAALKYIGVNKEYEEICINRCLN